MGVRALWRSVREPRTLKSIYGAIYSVVLLGGIGTLLSPPQSIAGELGPVLTVIWSVAFIMGATGGMLSVMPGWWWAERLSIYFIWTGFGIYLFVVINLHFTANGSRITQIATIVIAVALFLIRRVQIHGYSFEPRR
ncbi:hypothetical protein [Herbiconiux sp. VKM Ac-2851]|uniref:hypothetical protein n=1 Tax=Herbiconiux sp. VKM Ac-2851 TaxID=2739025 RepID=UPI0015664BF8|nr:hypothetical protein [Herbiconiux sp. VKM Ac-2851]NQX36242.1 hypothetical protein [Herbiconiux sp. VKM Ac-2851]